MEIDKKGRAFVMKPNELPAGYGYTKIVANLSLEHTSCDITCSNFKSIYNVVNFEIPVNNTIPELQACEEISICKENTTYVLTIILKKLIDSNWAHQLVSYLCKQLNYCLYTHIYNPHGGVPRFGLKDMTIHIEYGKNNNSFDVYYHDMQAMCRVEEQSTINVLKVEWHNENYMQKKISHFLTAMASNDPIGKFLKLYHFFDVLTSCDKYKEQKQKYKNKDKKNIYPPDLFISNILIECGITEIQMGDVTPINSDLIRDFRVFRDKIVHEIVEDSKIHDILYIKLFPVIKQIVASPKMDYAGANWEQRHQRDTRST